jgi:hypothetical protein
MTFAVDNSYSCFNEDQLQNQSASDFLRAQEWLSVRSTEPEAQYICNLLEKFKEQKYDEKKSLHSLFGTTPGQLKYYQRNLLFLDAVKFLQNPGDRSYYPACFSLVAHIDTFRASAYGRCKTENRKFENQLESIMFKILEIDNKKTMRGDSIYKIVCDLCTWMNEPFFPSEK